MQYCEEIWKYTCYRGFKYQLWQPKKRGYTYSHLSDLCDTFLLSNLVNGVTCVKSQNGTSIDVMLTNRPRSFHNTSLIETGLSDGHKTIVSVFRASS